MGRAASPPTWACYEQIPYDDDDEEDCSDSASEGSCSEDGEDYAQAAHESGSDHEHVNSGDDGLDMDMEIDEEGGQGGVHKKTVDFQKDVKGKQRAIEPESESPKRRHPKKRRESVFTLRPILTIQKSQGFVWNQVCFTLPVLHATYDAHASLRTYSFLRISKIDVCVCTFLATNASNSITYANNFTDVASTSPPNSRGFISTSASSTNSALTDYEVEVVEIRVTEGDLDDIIP